MFEIKENNLENLFEVFRSALWEEKVKLLSDLSKNISNENSMAVLAFLIEITSELKIKVPSFAFETLEGHLNQIKRLLKDFLPSDCLFLLEKISEFDFQELVEERKVINAYDYLTKIITDSLITFSTKEIEQLVNIYFDKNNFVLQTDIFEYFLKKIDQSKFIGNKEREFIFKSIQNKEIENLLTFLEKSKSKDEIIYSIYFYNPKFYDNLVKFIINLQITNLYDCLPQINEKLLFSKEVDSNILLKILLERPILFDKTINFIINEVFEENKENLIKLISENYELLGKKIHLFPFSFTDILKISENNFDLFKNLMNNLEKYDNINCTELNSYLVKLTNDKKIEVFTIILKQESEIKKEIIKNFIENVSLPQELIEFFLKSLNDSYFYCMLPYYKKEKQLESLSKHLKDKESLNYFLKVFSLGELFYFSHYIKDISQAKNAIQLCIDHPQFSENVILFAIPKMEYENLPCLFMRSIILSYLKFKDKKLFVLILNKIIKKKFWNDQALVEGFVKMLELLSYDSIDVLKNIEHDILINFLKRNKSILNLCKEYFNKNKPSDYPSEHLRKTVYSIK